ncbi:MAG TPA: hypothetical protein VMI10_20360 [Terriglobales bacterium]|nr:hypothetical protein [Terriglobales bacterium]
MNNFEKLERAGFVEVKMLPPNWWVNVASKMALEFGAVEDADPRWLEECLKQPPREGHFVFYFAYGTPMSDRVCEEVLARVGQTGVRIEMRLINPER